MWKFIAAAVSVFSLGAAESRPVFELRGKILPHESGMVSLHAVASPFAASTLAGPDGDFRFKNIEAGAYTVSAYIPGRGETRRTVSSSKSIRMARHSTANLHRRYRSAS